MFGLVSKTSANSMVVKQGQRLFSPCAFSECESTREDLLSTENRRFRRDLDYSWANQTNVEVGNSDEDVMEVRIEGLEEELRLTRRKLKKIRREFKLFKETTKKEEDFENAVCLDHKGQIRADQEAWMHSPCVQCICDNFQMKCLQIQDCQS